MIRMVSDGVPFFYHAIYKLRVCGQIISHDKKMWQELCVSSGHLRFFRISIFKSTIKCKINYFLIRIFSIVCVIFFKFFYGSICCRTFAVCLKSQSPVFCGRRDRRDCFLRVHCSFTPCKKQRVKRARRPRNLNRRGRKSGLLEDMMTPVQ